MKYVALLVVALLAAATFVVPEPVSPVPEAPPPVAPAPFAVCPAAESARRSTSVVLAGTGSGTARASVFSAGEIVAEGDVPVGEGGTGRLELSDLTGLALSPVLVALPQAAPVGSIMQGDGWSALACRPGSGEVVVLPGGATSEGEEFEIRLANPFAGSAAVSLTVASEVGTESDPTLDEVVVPPRGVVTVDLASLLRGRLGMSVAVSPIEGRVIASAVQAGGGDVAAWQALQPELDWYVPVPSPRGVDTTLVIAAPGASEVPYQIDVYGPDGLSEAAAEGVVPARGHLEIPTSDLLEGPGAVRVLAAAPVGVTLRMTGDGVRAVAPGQPTPQPIWFLPGAGLLGRTRVLLFNPTEVDVRAQISSGNGVEAFETVTVGAGDLAGVWVPEGTSSLRVDADGDVVVSWFARGEGGLAADVAQPATATAAPVDLPPPTAPTTTTTTPPPTTTTPATTVPPTATTVPGSSTTAPAAGSSTATTAP